MKNTSTVLLLLFASYFSFSQEQDCFNLKYKDYFEALDMTSKLSRDEITMFSQIVVQQEPDSGPTIFSYMVPTLVYELEQFHSSCTVEKDMDYFNAIIELYSRLNGIDRSNLEEKSNDDKILFVANDFYADLDNKAYLDTYSKRDARNESFVSFDIGNQQTSSGLKETIKLESKFGEYKFFLMENKQQSLITFHNKNGDLEWTHIINNTDVIPYLKRTESPIMYTSLATIIPLIENERMVGKVDLIIRNDGDFIIISPKTF